MRTLVLLASILLTALTGFTGAAADPPSRPHELSGASARQVPLRVFIRSGPKTHGPGAHDYPRFLKEWVALLDQRGAKAAGAEAFPTRAQLAQTDVLVLHAQDAGTIANAVDRTNLRDFLARGGGLVVIHAGSVSNDPDWFKT